jgi:hypothetical protein
MTTVDSNACYVVAQPTTNRPTPICKQAHSKSTDEKWVILEYDHEAPMFDFVLRTAKLDRCDQIDVVIINE